MRAWHIANIPASPFVVAVRGPLEASIVLRTLANYDLYLGDLISSNTQGLEAYNEASGEWHEWYDRDGDDIHKYMENLL